tara:strand:- start:3421 stop:4242 length:822 start_codon:yes stop_codon:yes gene_type:complete
MENIDIKEISEKVKKLGAIGVNNFLNNRNLELVSKILKDVQEKGVTKGNYTGVYPVTTKNILVKILKLDFNQVKKSFLLKNIAKDLHLEKIAENILNDKVDLHMIDSYYNAKSDKNIISWHCDRADAAANPNTSMRLHHRSVKFFIYMTNAESSNGCLGYIPYSHKVVNALSNLVINKKIEYKTFWGLEDLRIQVSNHPVRDLIVKEIGEDKLNSFLNNSKFIEDQQKDTFEFDFEMRKGSVVIFDEFGVHRGAMPKKNNRLVLRFHYRKINQ